MSSLFSKALVYLGLVDEEQIEAEAADRFQSPASDEPPRRVEPVQQSRRVEPVQQSRRVEPPTSARMASRPSTRVEPPIASQMVRPVEIQSDILLVEEFGDARILADRVREKTPVVLDMRHAEQELVRRVVDFASGLIYALDGSMRKVGEGLIAVLPPRVILSRDEKRRLAGLGAYQLEDFDE